jgi:hypothetical protein
MVLHLHVSDFTIQNWNHTLVHYNKQELRPCSYVGLGDKNILQYCKYYLGTFFPSFVLTMNAFRIYVKIPQGFSNIRNLLNNMK